MSVSAAFSLGVAVCVMGLALAAYLVDVPLSWIVLAMIAALLFTYAVVRRRASRARRASREIGREA